MGHSLFKNIFSCVVFYFLFLSVFAQTSTNKLPDSITLANAVSYAVKNQTLIQQSQIDERITDQQIRSRLADWYPQLNFNYNYQHNFIIQTSVIGGNPVRLGVNNTSAAQFSATQNIFNRDALLARQTSSDVRLQSRQNTSDDKITLAVNVTKAFYDVLSTQQQIAVADANIIRIEKSLKDAFYQYKAGVVDKIDYKRATILLNNTKASKKSNEELLLAKIQFLKFQMNYPDSAAFKIAYDSAQMEQDAIIDTLVTPTYKNRIEYRRLETQRRLLQANVKYYKWAYIPTVSAFGSYNFNFQNNNFSKLYGTNFPNSFAGLTLGFPIFQGGKRKANIAVAELQLQRNELDITNLINAVNNEYTAAIAQYKSNYNNFTTQRENVALAQEVYDVIQLQYRSGIKTYLEVLTSETDLRTAQINYINALYQVLISKTDVQKALGQIIY